MSGSNKNLNNARVLDILAVKNHQAYQHMLRKLIWKVICGRYDDSDEETVKLFSEDAFTSLNHGNHDGYIILCLLAAHCRFIGKAAHLTNLIGGPELHIQCVNNNITQTTVINAGDMWKWASFCVFSNSVKLGYPSKQYLVYQATKLISDLMVSVDINNVSLTTYYRQHLTDAVYVLIRLAKTDDSLLGLIASTSFTVLVELCEVIDSSPSELIATSVNNDAAPSDADTARHRLWIELTKVALIEFLSIILFAEPSTSMYRPLSESLLGMSSCHWHHQVCSMIFLRAALYSTNSKRRGKDASAKDTKKSVKDKETLSQQKSMSRSFSGNAVGMRSKSAVSFNNTSAENSSTDKILLRANFPLAENSWILKDVCSTGHIRLICWSLIHSREDIRLLGADVLSALLSLAKSKEDPRRLDADICASFIEQGVVPLLISIAGGIPIILHSADCPVVGCPLPVWALFPEDNIRALASLIIVKCVDCLMASVNSALLERLAYALVYTRSTKLRGNILSGIILFSTDFPDVGRAIWNARTPTVSSSTESFSGSQSIIRSTTPTTEASGGQVFRSMLETAQNDPVEFRVVIEILIHRIHWGRKICGFAYNDNNNSNSVINHVAGEEGHVVDTSENNLVFEVKVWVHSGLSCPVELLSPPLAVVSLHSRFLSAHIHELLSYWSTIPDIKGKVTKSGQFPSDFRALEGEFDLWQELFSHITDEFLLKSSIPRLNVSKIIKLFEMAQKYRINSMQTQYSCALISRLSVDSIVQIFQCAVKIIEPMNIELISNVPQDIAQQLRLDADYSSRVTDDSLINLQRECLEFVGSHLEVLMTRGHRPKINPIIDSIVAHFKYIFIK